MIFWIFWTPSPLSAFGADLYCTIIKVTHPPLLRPLFHNLSTLECGRGRHLWMVPKVLMADWTWRAVSEVRGGDQVMDRQLRGAIQ